MSHDCRCCGLRPTERTALKYCAICSPQIRSAYKGASREAYRKVILDVRARALSSDPASNPPPSREWLDTFWKGVYEKYPALLIGTRQKGKVAFA